MYKVIVRPFSSLLMCIEMSFLHARVPVITLLAFLNVCYPFFSFDVSNPELTHFNYLEERHLVSATIGRPVEFIYHLHTPFP